MKVTDGKSITLIRIFVLVGAVVLSGCASTETEMLEEPAPVEAATPYRIGPEDVIEIVVWKNQDISRVVPVRPDGKISLPLLGDIDVSGRTTDDVKAIIIDKLGEYTDAADVVVIVREVNSPKASIQGEVEDPMTLILRRPTTLVQAIGEAGGFTEFAKKNRIVVLRKGATGEQRIVVNYFDIVSGKDSAQNLLLEPGDTVIVP